MHLTLEVKKKKNSFDFHISDIKMRTGLKREGSKGIAYALHTGGLSSGTNRFTEHRREQPWNIELGVANKYCFDNQAINKVNKQTKTLATLNAKAYIFLFNFTCIIYLFIFADSTRYW